MKSGLKEKSKLLAGVWIFYALIEMITPAFRRKRGFIGVLLVVVLAVKRIILSLLIVANIFMTLSFIEDKEEK